MAGGYGYYFEEKGGLMFDCLNQDLQDLRIAKMRFENPVHPQILKIMVQTK